MPDTSDEKPVPLAFRPAEAARMLGCSRATIFELMAAGRIKALKLSPRVTLIPRAELERLLTELPAYEPEARPDA
jgi:excisionase family DNA binding protein